MNISAKSRAAVALLWGWLAACNDASSPYFGTTEPRHGPRQLWSNLATEPEWIDPGLCSDSAGGSVIFNIFAGLVQPHPVTLRPMPDIARSWDISEDGLTYTFHLRESVWSDGTPLTAHDFVYSWRRVLDRATASKYATFLYPIKNAEAFHRQALSFQPIAPDVDEGALRALIDPIASVEAVSFDRTQSRAFVYLAGGEGALESTDRKVIAKLDGTNLGGARLEVAITGGNALAVRAVDDQTLEVRLEDPLPYFLDLMMFYTAQPVPRHVLESLEREGEHIALWTRPEHIVSNGPFVLKEWKFRQYMILERNPRYWAAKDVKLESVRLSMVESNNTTVNMYEAGELDYIGNSALPAEFIEHLSKYRDFASGPYLGTYFFWVNVKAKPVDDPRVRRALSLAIDRDSLVKYVTRGGQIPTADLVPDGVAGYRGLHSPRFDPGRARALLAEAGYPDGSGMPPITLMYNTSEGHKQIAQAVQFMWKQNLGIEVSLENQEWKVFLKSLQSLDFQLARMGWIGDYADPFTFLELMMKGNGNNHSNWADEEYDRLLREANSTADRAARLELMRRAEKRLSEAAPVIPLYVYTRAELVKPYVMGHFLNYQQRDMFKYVWIDERWYDGVPKEPLPNVAPEMPGRGAGR